MEVENKELPVWCTIDSIKPRFIKNLSENAAHLRLHGYSLVMNCGYIDRTDFNDLFYINISPHQQEKLRFAVGDRFEAIGRLKIDRGRIVFDKVWRIDFEHRSNAHTWDNSRALVAKQSATIFSKQPETCLLCSNGVLVDVIDNRNQEKGKRRELLCLEGIREYKNCYIPTLKNIDECNFHNNHIQ